MKGSMRSTALGAVLGFLAATALMPAAMLTLQNPSTRPTTTVSDAAVTFTIADLTAGSAAGGTFTEFVRYVTIQNLSTVDLEVEAGVTTTGRASCNYMVANGASVTITCWMDKMAIKNIGSGTADFNGSDRTVIVTGWR